MDDVFPKVFFDINRIQYPTAPELMQSDLAWSIPKVERQKEENDKGETLGVGYVYTDSDFRQTNLAKIIRKGTRPEKNEFSEILTSNGLKLHDPDNASMLSKAILDSIRGFKPVKSNFHPTTAILPEMMFGMDLNGMAGASPPNIALIIEQMYRLGARESDEEKRAAILWYKALGSNVGDRFFASLQKSIRQSSIVPDHVELPAPEELTHSDASPSMPEWMREVKTPFRFLNRSWEDLCSEEWVSALPRKRWADWATCVLRVSIGMGFLWESRFFRRIGQELLRDNFDLDTALDHILKSDPIAQWLPESEPVSVRDVNSLLKNLMSDGQNIHRFLKNDFCESYKDELNDKLDGCPKGETLATFIEFARDVVIKDPSIKSKLRGCFNTGINSYSSNLQEAINGTLDCRKRYGEDADYYSLIRRESRNYMVVSPGPEFMVVIASLAAKKPGQNTTLREVRKALLDLGLQPSRSLVVRELERTGLCQSSHDADDGVSVSPGFTP